MAMAEYNTKQRLIAVQMFQNCDPTLKQFTFVLILLSAHESVSEIVLCPDVMSHFKMCIDAFIDLQHLRWKRVRDGGQMIFAGV